MATILIVDDQVLNREFLTTLLGYGGHRLLEAADGAEALKIADADHPDLIITDILMPNMDGYEFVSRLHSNPSIANTPVIFYTATFREREANAMARACGVRCVLGKPSEPEVILQSVHQTLGLPQQATTAVPVNAMAGQPNGGHTGLTFQVSDYLAELGMSSNEILKMVDETGNNAPDDDGLAHLVQKLSQSLANLQMVSLRLTALIELGITLAAEHDPARLLENGCRVAQDLGVAKYAIVGIIDDTGTRLRHFSARGLDDAAREKLRAALVDASVLDSLLATRVAHRISGHNGGPASMGLPSSHPPIHSFLGVPIASQGRSYGWLYLADKLGTESFSEVDEQVVVTVGNQLAIAYENLILYESVQNGRRQLEAEVAERSRAQESLHRALRARTVMAKCNHVMVHANDEMVLLKDMCDTVVNAGGYHMAWIGYARDDGTIQPMAYAGAERGFLHGAPIRWADSPDGRCPTGTAIHLGHPCALSDIATQPGMGRWRDEALRRGYRSAVSLPLMEGDKALGALTLYESMPEGFNSFDVAMLEELADDIAYGVINLRARVARRKVEQELMSTKETLSGILGSIDNIVWSVADGRLLYVNKIVEEIYGRPIEEFVQNRRLWIEAIHPDDRPAVRDRAWQLHRHGSIIQEYRILRPDRTVRWIEHRSKLIRDSFGMPVRVDAVESDITARKEYEARIHYLASHDALTGLANRNLLNDRIAQAMSHARRSDTLLALLFLDLDRFKAVNDSIGHSIGDSLLKSVAMRLREAIRDGDTVARQGGDEFIILLTHLLETRDVVDVTRKILGVFSRPFVLESHELYITASIGVTVYPHDADNLEDMLRNADTAMYQAKNEHGSSYQFYSRDMSARVMERVRLEGALRRALEHREFEVFYQPKPDLRSGKIIGAEALLRWHHPELGMISPEAFIPVAEEAGLIVPIGRWVLETACMQNKTWQDSGLPLISVAVNLSARQFMQQELVGVVAETLRYTGLHAGFLELELTESMVMNNAEHFIEKLSVLKALGVLLSIDDFGTGYSSLSYLKRFSLDRLKIDKSFIRDIATDPDDAAITRSVIALGHSLNLKVIAEGVETTQQLDFLRDHDCDEMQGFYFSRALSADDFASLLQSGSRLYN